MASSSYPRDMELGAAADAGPDSAPWTQDERRQIERDFKRFATRGDDAVPSKTGKFDGLFVTKQAFIRYIRRAPDVSLVSEEKPKPVGHEPLAQHRHRERSHSVAHDEIFTSLIFQSFAGRSDRLSFDEYDEACRILVHGSKAEKLVWLYYAARPNLMPVRGTSFDYALAWPWALDKRAAQRVLRSARAGLKAPMSSNDVVQLVDEVMRANVLASTGILADSLVRLGPSTDDTLRAADNSSDSGTPPNQPEQSSLRSIASTYAKLEGGQRVTDVDGFVQMVARSLRYWEVAGKHFVRFFSIEHSSRQSEQQRLDSIKLLTSSPRLQEAFQKYSLPSGRLTVDSFYEFLASFGFVSQRLAAMVVAAYSSQMNPNTIAYQDVVDILAILAHGSRKEQLQWLCFLLDTKKRQVVSRAALQELIHELAEAAQTGSETSTTDRSMKREFVKMEQAYRLLVDACFEEARLIRADNGSELKQHGNDSPRDECVAFSELLHCLERWELRTDFMEAIVTLVGTDLGADESTTMKQSEETLIAAVPTTHDEDTPDDHPAVVSGQSSNRVVPDKSLTKLHRQAGSTIYFAERRRKWTCRKVFMFSMLVSIQLAYFFMVAFPGVLADSIQEHFGVSKSLLGTLGGMQYVGYIVGLFTSERMINAFGPHFCLKVNTVIDLLGVVAAVIGVHTARFPLLLLGVALWGLGDNYLLISILFSKYFSDTLATAFGLSYSIFLGSIAVASVVLPIIDSTSFLLAMDLVSLMVVVSCASALLFFLSERMYVNEIGEEAFVEFELSKTRKAGDASFVGFITKMAQLAPLLKPHTSILGSFAPSELKQYPRNFWYICLHAILLYGVISSTFVFVPSYIEEEFGLSTVTAGLLVPGLVNLLCIVLSPTVGYIFDNKGVRVYTALLATVVMGAAIVVLLAVPTVAAPVLFAIFEAFSTAVTRAFGIPALTVIVKPSLRSAGTTIFLIFWGVGVVIYSNVAGALVDNFGFYTYAVVCICSVIVSFGVMFRIGMNDTVQTCGELNALPTTINLRQVPMVRFSKVITMESSDETKKSNSPRGGNGAPGGVRLDFRRVLSLN